MNPFLEIPGRIVNNENKEAVVEFRIRPGEIEYYYAGFYGKTVVVMKSGQSFLADLERQEFDQALELYANEIKKKSIAGVSALKFTKK